jgi:hypothetical protein
MGTYKAIVLEAVLQKTKTSGMPQFVTRVFLTEYYDKKEQQWFDVSDNNWSLNGYFCLYGRKDSQPNGEIVPTLNHTQVCKVFGWNGIGFSYLTQTDFNGKTVQVRIAENTGENAKSPVQIAWIDTEDADPNQGLQKLDEKGVKDLEGEFASLWAGKAPKAPVASAPKAAKPAAKPPVAPKTETRPPATPAPEPDTPPANDKDAKKKALLEKSKRLRKEAEKAPPAKPPASQPPSPAQDIVPVPSGYDKRQAWCDIVELKDEACSDDQLNASDRKSVV